MKKNESQRITKFGLIRHGQTEWNREKRIQGQSESVLTREGLDQAEHWGDRLQGMGWTRIVASDLGRAIQTADIVNSYLRLPLFTDRRLREQDWGEWVGITLPRIETEHRVILKQQEQTGWGFRPPGGEDRLQVLTRSLSFLTEAAHNYPGEKILIVCHGGVIKCLLYHLSARKFLPTEPKLIRPYHLHMLRHDGEDLRIDRINAMDLEVNKVG